MKQTRADCAWKNATTPPLVLAQSQASQARGILHPHLAQQQYQHFVEPVVAELQTHLQGCWMVRWDSPASAHTQVVLSHPHCHLVFEDNTLNFYGVQSKIFRKSLNGKGQAFGIKFQAASAWCLWRRPMLALCDQKFAVPELAQRFWPGLDLAWASQADWPELHEHVVRGLTRIEFDDRKKITDLNQLVASLRRDPSHGSVANLAAQLACSPRQLQRDCANFIGIHPKWLIQRCRLHQALADLQAAQTSPPALADLALRAGYYDQAHFTADFLAITGYTPHAYWCYLHSPCT